MKYPSISSFLALVVADVMTTQWVHVSADEPIVRLRRLFHIHEFNALPVMQGGRMCGWVSQYDVLKPFVYSDGEPVVPIEEILQQPVASIMVAEPESVTSTDTLSRVIRRMVESRHPSYPVVDAGQLVGIVARTDVFRYLDGTVDWI